ncbi:type II secretion system GspH family protein [Burkholderiaceae bacterium DAT-1]|nr:type II secretion system GspH family protein [Burkholderiaceae bacterium DAT-1]
MHSRRYLASRHAGFTYIELVISLAILSILALGALPLAEVAVKRDKEVQLRRALREIRTAIDAYKAAVDQGLIAKDRQSTGYPATLDTLAGGITNVKQPGSKLYFLRRIPRDPFANEALPANQSWGLRSYASDPETPLAGDDVFDVYSQSPLTGLNGIPYRNW